MPLIWNPLALPWAVMAAGLFALTALIFRRQGVSRVAVLFCAMIALVGLWFTGVAAMLSTSAAPVAEWWARFTLAAIALLPAAVHDFSATALRLPASRARLIRSLWVIFAIFAILALFTRAIVAGVARHPWGFYPVLGKAGPLFLLLFLGALLAHMVEGIREHQRTEDPQRRRRIAKLLLSFAVVYASLVDFLPMLGVKMQPVGYIPVLGFLLVAWGSIRQHRFQSISAARAAREILQTMADALFVIDADGRIRVINDSVTTLFGFKEADILGRSIDTLEPVAGDETISRTLGEISRRGPIRDQERIFRHRDGTAIDVSVSISPVSEEDVQRGAVVIARDIRERKLAQQELQSALERLQLSNRELEEFAYVASHDLQEPLRKIQAFGDLLESKHAAALEPQARDYIERMRSAAKRMQVLINDLLAFSRVSTKGQPFVEVDLHAVAHEVVKDLETRVQDAGGRIDVGALPVIHADPLQMRQLLQNLAGNALKFHRPGVPPLVSIAGAVEHDSCILRVNDNGIGFEQKYAERIFTMFERLHGRGAYDGTGIGLAICRRIAERHGGNIVAHSTPGEGSMFIVTLPVHHGDHREHPGTPSLNIPVGGTHGTTTR